MEPMHLKETAILIGASKPHAYIECRFASNVGTRFPCQLDKQVKSFWVEMCLYQMLGCCILDCSTVQVLFQKLSLSWVNIRLLFWERHLSRIRVLYREHNPSSIRVMPDIGLFQKPSLSWVNARVLYWEHSPSSVRVLCWERHLVRVRASFWGCHLGRVRALFQGCSHSPSRVRGLFQGCSRVRALFRGCSLSPSRVRVLFRECSPLHNHSLSKFNAEVHPSCVELVIQGQQAPAGHYFCSPQ